MYLQEYKECSETRDNLNLIKINKLSTVMVSTVRVLLLMVWELTISPVALYAPSSDSSATLRVSVATTGTCVVLCRSGSPRIEGSLYTILSVCTIGCGPPLPGCLWVATKLMLHTSYIISVLSLICIIFKVSFLFLYVLYGFISCYMY